MQYPRVPFKGNAPADITVNTTHGLTLNYTTVATLAISKPPTPLKPMTRNLDLDLDLDLD